MDTQEEQIIQGWLQFFVEHRQPSNYLHMKDGWPRYAKRIELGSCYVSSSSENTNSEVAVNNGEEQEDNKNKNKTPKWSAADRLNAKRKGSKQASNDHKRLNVEVDVGDELDENKTKTQFCAALRLKIYREVTSIKEKEYTRALDKESDLDEICRQYRFSRNSLKTFMCRCKPKLRDLEQQVQMGKGHHYRRSSPKQESPTKHAKSQTKKASTKHAKSNKSTKKAKPPTKKSSTEHAKPPTLLIPNNSPAYNMLDTLVDHLCSAPVLEYAAKREISDQINGGLKVSMSAPIVTGKASFFKKLMDGTMDKANPISTPWACIETTLIQYVNSYLSTTVHHKEAEVRTMEILQQQPASCCKTQVTHSDLKNNYPSSQIQGIVILTPDSEGPIVYDMTGVPPHPEPKDVVKAFCSIKQFPPGCTNLTKLFLSLPKVVQLLADWGQLCFATDSRRPEKKIAPKYSVHLFEGSHPHCGPGTIGAHTRMVLSFTAAKTDSTAEPYNNEQMSREKLMGHLMHCVAPTLIANKDYITLSYLSSIWAEYVCNSAKHDSFDATAVAEFEGSKLVTKRFIKMYKHLCQTALDHYNAPSAETKSNLDLVKQGFETYYMVADIILK